MLTGKAMRTEPFENFPWWIVAVCNAVGAAWFVVIDSADVLAVGAEDFHVFLDALTIDHTVSPFTPGRTPRAVMCRTNPPGRPLVP